MSKVYISGPMTGLPQFNFPAFDSIEELLVAAGCDVFSPAANDRVHWAADGLHDVEEQAYFIDGDVAAYAAAVQLPVETLYRDDFNYIINEADAIVLLPGWEKSTGARYELALAEALLLDIVLAIETPDGWSLVPTGDKSVTEYLRSFPHGPAVTTLPAEDYAYVVGGTLTVHELIAELKRQVPSQAGAIERIAAVLA